MQQMEVEEEEMTQGVAERWSRNYKAFLKFVTHLSS